jgi:sulfate adenylyltransferase
MRLSNGYVWSIPIILDVSPEEVSDRGVRPGSRLLLTQRGAPLAVLNVEEVFTFDKEEMARHVFGTADPKHPGVRRTLAQKDLLLGGPLSLVVPPRLGAPFDRFFFTPRAMRERIKQHGWRRVVAHQTRNVPHTGHEWLMKSAWFSAQADAVLVNAVVGEKRLGDYIDEAILLGHDMLRQAGYFRPEVHQTSLLLWDMRYAGPREAVFHAIVRKNLGCTHHMFGRDHAGVGTYYDTYAAHRIFDDLPDLGIRPVVTLEWAYCPECQGIAYEGLCGHDRSRQAFSGSVIRSILQDGVKPPRLIFRPEVFDVVTRAADEYGFGSPFVTERYLHERNPVLEFGRSAGEVTG